MWYHTDVNDRIMESTGRRTEEETGFEADSGARHPASLQTLCAARVISAKLNFFAAPTELVPDAVKNMLAGVGGQVRLAKSGVA
jgi:hypothetical protein